MAAMKLTASFEENECLRQKEHSLSICSSIALKTWPKSGAEVKRKSCNLMSQVRSKVFTDLKYFIDNSYYFRND